MKAVLKFFAGLAILFGISGAIIYFIYPGVMLAGLQAVTANGAGLEKKHITIQGYTAHYYEGGVVNPKTLVLLHGLGDDKNSFVTSVRELAQRYRVILPDLQAHGENQQAPDRDYSIAGQVRFIDDLLASIDTESVIIGGNSMGGHIAAAYTARYPKKVEGLVVVNATGMQLENESVYVYYPEKVNTDFFKELFDRIFVTPPTFPDPILQHLANELNPKIPFYNDLIRQVESGEDFRLNEKATSITSPALVLWGKQDPIVGLNYAKAYQNKLVNSKLVVIDNAGHSPQFEVPERIQSEITTFINDLQ